MGIVRLLAASWMLVTALALGACGTTGRGTDAAATSRAPAEIAASFGRLPLAFEPLDDESTPPRRFLSRADGFGAVLTPAETTLMLERRHGASPGAPVVIGMELVGANPSAEARAGYRLSGTTNYLFGADPRRWRTGVARFGTVEYRAVYPGIDVVYHGTQRRLEYDFVIAPWADPDRVRVAFKGAHALSVDAAGDLVVDTDAGRMRLARPRASQTVRGDTVAVDARYALLGDSCPASGCRERSPLIGIRVGAYDRDRPLVIDPTLVYSTYFGGLNADAAEGIAVDAAGNAYITGTSFIPAGIPIIPPTFEPQGGVAGVVFVVKVSADGSRILYSTVLGGTGEQFGAAIAVDSVGSAYVTGEVVRSAGTTPDFPITANAVQARFAGGCGDRDSDAFVAKLSPDGSRLLFSSFLGGACTDRGTGIALDPRGNVYVTGSTRSALTFGGLTSRLLASGASLTATSTAPEHVFVVKLPPDLSRCTYATLLGGSRLDAVTLGGNDNAFGIAADPAGNAYITGRTETSNFPTVSPIQPARRGASDAFLTKVSADGTRLMFSTYLGGSAEEFGFAVAVDAAGIAVIAGSTTSTDLPTTAGVVQPASHASGDAFVAKIDTILGRLVFSTALGGINADSASGVALDGAGNVYVVGTTLSLDFPTASALPRRCTGTIDVFVARLTPAGRSLDYSTCLGGSDSDMGTALAVDAAGNAYVTGFTSSVDFPTTPGAAQTRLSPPSALGASDAFVAKLAQPTLIPSFVTPAAGALVSGLMSVTVAATSTTGPTQFTLAIDNRVVATQTVATSPAAFTIDTSTLTNGIHTLTVTTANAGRTATTSQQVTVSNATFSATFVAPASGATLSGTPTITLGTSLAGGTARTFTLAVDSTTVMTTTVTTSTVSHALTTAALANGAHTLTMSVTSAGQTAVATLPVTIANGVTTLPGALVVTFTAPSSGATISGTTTVSATVTGVTGSAVATLAVDGVNTATQTVIGNAAGTASVVMSLNTATLSNGSHTLTFTVINGGRTAIATLPVTVANSTASFTASFLFPPADARVAGNQTVGMSTTAPWGTPKTFTLTMDGRVIIRQPVTGTTLWIQWNTRTVANGARTLTLVVTDRAGRSAIATRRVTVAN